MQARRMELKIDGQWAGQPVHNLLRRGLGLSGTLLRRIKWLDDGILLDGQRVHTRVIVRQGQTLSVRLSDPAAKGDIPPVCLPLDIVYEDRDITVINKAPGMPSHPGPGHWDDSLGNALVYHWQQTDPWADFHPVHRLDKGTTGLMVVAKHPFAQEQLRSALHTKSFQREYLAVCEGSLCPAQGVIDLPIGRAEGSILKRQVTPDGQSAITHYQVICSDGIRSLVRLRLETGRTHQIRVHLSHLGHPLVGDFLYGTEDSSLIARPALHSSKLSLLHPVTGQPLTFDQSLPEDMAHLADAFCQ